MDEKKRFKMFEQLVHQYSIRQLTLLQLFAQLKKLFTTMVMMSVYMIASHTPTPAQSTRFVIISDYGSNDSNQMKVATLVRQLQPSFIITAGDNFHRTLTPLDDMVKRHYGWIWPNFFPVAGNHDITDATNYFFNDDNYLISYRDYFAHLPMIPANRRYYDLEKSGVWFGMFNSDFGGVATYCPNGRMIYEPHGIDSMSRQWQWFKSRLNQTTARWKLMVMHYPPFFSFPYDYDTTTIVNCNGSPYRLKIKVDTLFAKLRLPFTGAGVDMVVSGHTHCGEVLKVNGLPFYVQLSGGAYLGNNFSNRHPYSKRFYKLKYGATAVDVDRDSLTFRLITVDRDTVWSFNVYQKNSIRLTAKTMSRPDTITAYVRQHEMPYAIIDSCRRVASENVVMSFPNVRAGVPYHIQVKHRNSIAVWTRNAVTFNDSLTVVDMSVKSNVAGENIDESGRMFSGNANGDMIVDGTDVALVTDDAKQFRTGYVNTDMTGNKFVDANDVSVTDGNAYFYRCEVMP